MNMDNVKLICGDDIYYTQHKFELLDIFREKKENKYDILFNMAEDQYLRIPHAEESQALGYDFGE